jgi:hypothetical protein
MMVDKTWEEDVKTNFKVLIILTFLARKNTLSTVKQTAEVCKCQNKTA